MDPRMQPTTFASGEYKRTRSSRLKSKHVLEPSAGTETTTTQNITIATRMKVHAILEAMNTTLAAKAVVHANIAEVQGSVNPSTMRRREDHKDTHHRRRLTDTKPNVIDAIGSDSLTAIPTLNNYQPSLDRVAYLEDQLARVVRRVFVMMQDVAMRRLQEEKHRGGMQDIAMRSLQRELDEIHRKEEDQNGRARKAEEQIRILRARCNALEEERTDLQRKVDCTCAGT